nr:MAG TPA: hypothetical protein [Caudoviricetes sp.]
MPLKKRRVPFECPNIPQGSRTVGNVGFDVLCACSIPTLASTDSSASETACFQRFRAY